MLAISCSEKLACYLAKTAAHRRAAFRLQKVLGTLQKGGAAAATSKKRLGIKIFFALCLFFGFASIGLHVKETDGNGKIQPRRRKLQAQ